MCGIAHGCHLIMLEVLKAVEGHAMRMRLYRRVCLNVCFRVIVMTCRTTPRVTHQNNSECIQPTLAQPPNTLGLNPCIPWSKPKHPRFNNLLCGFLKLKLEVSFDLHTLVAVSKDAFSF